LKILVIKKKPFLKFPGIFPNSEQQKLLLGGLQHHCAKFQVNRSTIRIFMRVLDESRAEEMRDGPMISLAKMIFMTSTFTRA
jgi:hypothetical protein